ncbi:MAG: siroheme synthase CysG [Steroidobacteraceae bacterium]
MDYLPVFLDLAGRGVLVVGGGAVALRKVELLVQARARVRVAAPRLLAELVRARETGRIEHIAAPFEPRQLDSMVLAIAATDRPEVNRAVAAAGAARGIFVNVVDDAEASSFIMPAIIDRSPVLIAVGTAGNSPTLARRLRAQLEAALPGRLGELAVLAGRMRARVRAALPDPQRRQQFWERLFGGSIASQVLAGQGETAAAMMEAELETLRAAAEVTAINTGGTGPAVRGEVYLIGAGPGDPDLLTLRAQQLLQQADVVLYDRLVSEAVLGRVRREATRVYVGKESGRHRITQERIHALLLDHAQRGLRVARLKGGDPFIFARGGEEIEVLRRAGVAVIVVPGITAALGAAASIGLPLTQRGLAQSVTFVTAMGEGAEALDWRSLAAPLQTVVFYMGVAQLPRIVERLLAQGAPGDRPAVIVERATLPSQRLLAASLSQIEARARAAQIDAPALLIVGEVARQACMADNVIP